MTGTRFLSALVFITVMWGTATQDRALLTKDMITEEMLRQGAMLLAEGTCSRCHSRDAQSTRFGELCS